MYLKNPYFEALDLVSSQSGALSDVVKLDSGIRIVVSHDEGAVCPAGVLVEVVVLAEGLGPDCVSWCCEEG